MSESYEPPTREAAAHPARAAEEYGLVLTKAQKAALDAFDIARSREKKAHRMAALVRTEAVREWQQAKDADGREQASTVEPEDFVPFTETKPDPDEFAEMARLYRNARADAQNAVSDSFRGNNTFAKIEAAFLRSQVMPIPASATVTEWAVAEVMRDAAGVALHAFNLWLAVDSGASKAEIALIRRAAKEGRLCSLETARDIRAGKTPEALAAQAAQEAEAEKAKAINTESSGASARYRNPRPEAGA